MIVNKLFFLCNVEEKRRKYDQLGRAGLSNGHGNSSHSSNGGYSRFSEDFLNRTFHFHNPFDIFEQFMSHFGMDDDFGKFYFVVFNRKKREASGYQIEIRFLSLSYILQLILVDKWTRQVLHFGERTMRIKKKRMIFFIRNL